MKPGEFPPWWQVHPPAPGKPDPDNHHNHRTTGRRHEKQRNYLLGTCTARSHGTAAAPACERASANMTATPPSCLEPSFFARQLRFRLWPALPTGPFTGPVSCAPGSLARRRLDSSFLLVERAALPQGPTRHPEHRERRLATWNSQGASHWPAAARAAVSAC